MSRGLKFTITTPEAVRSHLPKRRAIYEVCKTLAESGVPITTMQQLIEKAWPRSRPYFCSALGEDLDSDTFIAAVKEQSQAAGRVFDPGRFFCNDSELIRSDGRTYAFSNQWGVETSTCIDALLRAYPDKGISYATDEAT